MLLPRMGNVFAGVDDMNGLRWRWAIVLWMVAAGFWAGGLRFTSAQSDANSLFAGMGYPELAIEISDTGIELPPSVPAGRTLISVHNSGSTPARAELALAPDLSATAGTSVAPAGLTPNWLANNTFPGMPNWTPPGATGYAVSDLLPGQYTVSTGMTVRSLTVFDPPESVTSPAPAADPASTTTVSLFEFDFQLPANVSRGAQIWRVVNAGRMPHELQLAAIPEGTTRDDLLDAIGRAQMPGTPVGGLSQLSPGSAAWLEVDLPPGTYAAVCYIIDPDTSQPHALEGMVETFEVS
jgi:hypothetical protein